MMYDRPFYESRTKNKIFDCHAWAHPNFPVHMHKHIEFVYVAGGELKMTVSGKEYLVRPGDCVLVFPYQIHSFSSDGEVDLTLVIADMEYVGEFQEELAYNEMVCPYFHKTELSSYGVKILDLIRESAYDKDVPYQLDKGLFMVLLTDIFRSLPMNTRQKPADLTMAQKILQYINQNILQEISATEVAKALGISPYYLSHIFSEELKITFPNYVAQQRLSFACDLLRNTKKSVTDISYETGFPNMRTFHRCFKKQYGCTPMEWRKVNARKKKEVGSAR